MSKEDKNKSLKSDLQNFFQRFRKRIKEEKEQYDRMGGIGEYVTHNVVSLNVKLAKGLGDDEAAQKIESHRKKIVNKGKKIDKVVKGEIEGLKHFDDAKITIGSNIGLDLEIKPFSEDAERISIAGNHVNQAKGNFYENIEQKNPVQAVSTTLKDSSFSSKTLAPAYTYNKAEIVRSDNGDSSFVEVSMIDGKKHGVEIAYNADKTIKNVKLYDHGKEIDLKKHKIEVKQDKTEGFNHQYVLLDGQKFGMETYFDDKHQNLAVTFYEKDGMMNRSSNAMITYSHQSNRDVLAQDLAQQTGNLSDGVVAQSQSMRYDMRIKKKEAKAKESKPKSKTVKNENTAESQILMTNAQAQR